MFPKKHRLILAVSLAAIATLNLGAQNPAPQSAYRFQHYSTENGLANEFFNNAVNDSLGYTWAFYAGGLSRFDGYNFKVFRYNEHDPRRSALNFNIGKILLDATNNIWLVEELNQVVSPLIMVKYDWKADRFVKYNFDLKGGISIGAYSFEKDNSSIWIAAGGNRSILRLDFKSGETQKFEMPASDPIKQEADNIVRAIQNYDTALLVGTHNGLWLFGKKSKKFFRPPCRPEDQELLYQSRVVWFTRLKKDEENSIWLRTNPQPDIGLLIKIDSNFSVVHKTDKVMTGLNAFAPDDESIWFNHLDSGLFRYNVRDSSLINIRAVPGDKHSLQSNSIGDIHVDGDRTVWIVYRGKGISRLSGIALDYQNVDMRGLHASMVYQAGEEEYFVLNQNWDIMMSSIGPGSDSKLEFQSAFPPLQRGRVTGFWKGQKHLWMSVLAGAMGVIGYPINEETGRVETSPALNLVHDPGNPNTLATNVVSGVWESPSGDLWLAHLDKGLSRVNPKVPYGTDGSVFRYKNVEGDTNSLVSNRAWSFIGEDDKSAWVLTWDGVDLMHFGPGAEVVFEHVFRRREVPNVLFRTSDGQLFLGTTNGLYMAAKENGKYRFVFQSLVGETSISGIQEDEFGRLWLKGTRALIYFDRRENTKVHLTEQDGMDHLRAMSYTNMETHHGLHRTKNGLLIVVDPDGFTVLDPKTFQVDRRPVLPVLTDLLVNNRATQIGGEPGDGAGYVVPSHIGALSELVLDYLHNNFTIEFSALQMTAPEKNQYRHKLDGFDEDWIQTDYTNRAATYTNLPPGRYTFRVKASNHLGIWSDQERILTIIALPPPWKTWWAYSLYAAAMVGLLFSWRRYDSKRLKLKHRAEHLGELDTIKTLFFTNISHEFRTPITLLLGPLKEMYSKATSNGDKNTIGTMLRNGQRLSGLINQLLDISKLEAGKMALQASELDVVQLLKEITSSYESVAVDKNIKYTFYPEVRKLIAFVDQEKVETVIHNLLSNAFKFTPGGGEVLVHLKVHQSDQYQIIVKDSGIGIPAEQHEKIFDRFYQVDSSKTRNYEGTGLGMALAKELVQLHHGKISLESSVGEGTTFTVELPISKKYFGAGEILVDGEQTLSSARKDGFSIPTLSGAEAIGSEKPVDEDLPVVLIVEDNPDMRQFIRKTVSDGYNVIEANDGQDGLDKALSQIPDLIISDIMMPRMDGYELCGKIKNNELTSHVPVILLTAKADRDSKIAGLETGADDYLSKPFDAEELKLIVRNRLNEINKLRDRFSREVTLEPKKIAITSLDEKFVTRLMAIIEVHIGDELFSIDDLAKEMAFSNMHLYRKIKALSGETPSVFLRTIRLKRAAELLAKNSDNVTQIAYSVGFSSLSYFTKCFKDQFGVTPGNYAQEGLRK